MVKIPKAPISAKTHGDPRLWTEEQWRLFLEWARNLKNFPDKRVSKGKKGKAKRTSSSTKKKPASAELGD